MATTIYHDITRTPISSGEPCGGVFHGDWDTVTCSTCGLRLNTLDIHPSKDHVLRFAENGSVLVEVEYL